MTVECGIDFRSEWGYLYCTICKDVSLIGMILDSKELIKEKEMFEEMHKHE